MNIFNSLGSNYNFNFVLKSLFGGFNNSAKEELKTFLEKKYGGEVILLYKGRQAIGLALEVLRLHQMSSRGSGEARDVAIPSEKRLLRPSRLARDPRNDNLNYVAINGFTCFAVYKSVENAGYEVELLDLEDDGLGLNFSPQELSKAIKKNPKIKVVIIQNTLGYPCEIQGIAKICKENNIILIEDLAHCAGTRYSNGKEAGLPREAGTVGDMVVLSFSQDKIIDAVSGGALIIRNPDLKAKTPRRWQAESHDSFEVDSNVKLRGNNVALRNETMKQLNNVNNRHQLLDRLYPPFTFIIRKTYPIGLGKLIHLILKNFNLLSKPMADLDLAGQTHKTYEVAIKHHLPNWHASLALDSLKNLNKNLEHRRKIANIYNSMLRPTMSEINLSSNLRYPIFVENRASLIDYLKKQGVYVSDIWYDSVDESLTNAKAVSEKILNLPTHINVSEKEAKRICEIINGWATSNRLP